MIERRLIDEMVEFLGAEVSADLLMKVVRSIDEHMLLLRAAVDTPAQAALCAHKIHGLSTTYGLTVLAEAVSAIACEDVEPIRLSDLVAHAEEVAEETKARLWGCANLLRRLA